MIRSGLFCPICGCLFCYAPNKNGLCNECFAEWKKKHSTEQPSDESASGNLMVLGGNQGDAVRISEFSLDRVIGYRWPSVAPLPERYNLPIIGSDGKLSTNEA